MLVSHRYRFIYLKTAKTAGTSVECYFEPYCTDASYRIVRHGCSEHVTSGGIIGARGQDVEAFKYRNHMNAIDVRSCLPTESWESYFRFCAIRNPYDIAVSCFFFSFRSRKQFFFGLSPAQLREQFGRWLVENRSVPSLLPYCCIDGQLCVDDVIRFETLEQDMERICRKVGVGWHPQWMPRLKTGFRPPTATIESVYSLESRRIIENISAEELDLFNYSFPS